jgi:hypothetical protein
LIPNSSNAKYFPPREKPMALTPAGSSAKVTGENAAINKAIQINRDIFFIKLFSQ